MDTKLRLAKQAVAANTGLIDFIGYGTSSIFLIIAILILKGCSELKHKRFKIHLCLFITMLVVAGVRLSQLTYQEMHEDKSNHNSKNFSYMCTAMHVLKEYSTFSEFAWMLVEGVYLNKNISKKAITKEFPLKKYAGIAWVLPLLYVAAWVIYAILTRQYSEICIFGYNLRDFLWFVQGPQLIIILINIGIGVNVMRALINKLRRTRHTNMQKLKKGLKAAFILLPLLGITNLLSVLESFATHMELFQYALWSYSAHILDSFQGAILAIIYCFFAKEVRRGFKRRYNNLKAQLSPCIAKRNFETRRTRSLPAIWSTDQVQQSSNERKIICKCFPSRLQHLDLCKVMEDPKHQQRFTEAEVDLMFRFENLRIQEYVVDSRRARGIADMNFNGDLRRGSGFYDETEV